MTDQTIVIHLSSEDPYKAGKAIRFAKNSLNHAEHSIMFLSAYGVKVVQRSSDGFTIPGTDVNSLDAIREFLKDGGQIFAGKDCLKLFKIQPTDIIAGCEQADPETTFKYLMAENTKMISW